MINRTTVIDASGSLYFLTFTSAPHSSYIKIIVKELSDIENKPIITGTVLIEDARQIHISGQIRVKHFSALIMTIESELRFLLTHRKNYVISAMN